MPATAALTRSISPAGRWVTINYLSALHSHLANLVVRTGRTVRFDAQSIPGDPEANRPVGRQNRNHWAAPKPV